MANNDDDGYKATFSIKADSMPDLIEALEAIAHAANVGIAMEQKVSASVAITSPSIENLQVILDAAAENIADSHSEAEVSTKAPLAAYAKRRLDPTPMERAINSVTITHTSPLALDKFRAAANHIDLRNVPRTNDGNIIADEDEGDDQE